MEKNSVKSEMMDIDTSPAAILPGATLGVLGGGQLGRMFVIAARTMGYEVVVLDPDPDAPAGSLATQHLCASYDDPKALAQLAEQCVAITTEFENVPAHSLRALAAQGARVSPSGTCVEVTQDRLREKGFLRQHSFPVGDFWAIRDANDAKNAGEKAQFPAILKTARFGYDGKGQIRVEGPELLSEAWQELGSVACILEALVDIEVEISAIVARADDGSARVFQCAENRHTDGILDVSIAPATVSPDLQQKAQDYAAKIAEALGYVGVMAVEFFVDRTGNLLVNEIAPRPHNSGHHTIDACRTSQYVQQVRTLCRLPLGDTTQHSVSVMVNLLGDAWDPECSGTEQEPAWQELLKEPGLALHLYGKKEARPGRKMGHFTMIGESHERVTPNALRLRELIRSGNTTRE